MVSRHLISTEPMAGQCARCKSWILVGLAEGLWTHVDPFPLDRLSEAIALITGRWCYTLTGRSLIRRDGSIRPGPVLAEHRCGEPLGVRLHVPPPAPESSRPPY